METPQSMSIIVGILALQGAFREHAMLLQQAELLLELPNNPQWTFIEVRNAQELGQCNALIIPGGESTTMALVAAASGLLDPLREFVKVKRLPVWGTCAGLIFLAEAANRTKTGGQDLIGGLDVRVNRNHFGRQTESFIVDLDLPFLTSTPMQNPPFQGIFIRAPIVEKILSTVVGEQAEEGKQENTVIAPARQIVDHRFAKYVNAPVEIMARLPKRTARLNDEADQPAIDPEAGDIIAVKQGNVFGTSFHPELTQDPRIHLWWLKQVFDSVSVQNEI